MKEILFPKLPYMLFYFELSGLQINYQNNFLPRAFLIMLQALAALVCTGFKGEVKKTTLPCEADYGAKKFQNGKLILISNGEFRATVSACHAMLLPEDASNGGGSLNLLYHKNYGVICAATSAEYVPSEPLNQQYQRNSDVIPCMTAQFTVDGRMGCKDKDVTVDAEGYTVTATAKKWSAAYSVDGNVFTARLTSEGGTYSFPIVCARDSTVTVEDNCHTVRSGDRLTLRSGTPLKVDPNKRVFNQVGGLLYLPVTLTVNGSEKLTLTVE